MTDLDSYLQSFLRLQGEIAKDIKFTSIRDKEYRLTIYPNGPTDDFLPVRISKSVVELILKLDNSVEEIDVTCYTNLRRLVIEKKRQISNPPTFYIRGKCQLNSLEIHELNVKNLIIMNQDLLKRLERLIIQVEHLSTIDPSKLSSISFLKMHTNFSKSYIDLSSLTKLKEVSIRGNLEPNDGDQLRRITFPESLTNLYLNYMMAETIDLGDLSNISHLTLSRIRKSSEGNAPEIIWPGRSFFNKIRYLRINNISFETELVKFSGGDFPYLEELYFENHMNKMIILEELDQLKTFKTNIARYVIGHQVDLFLVDCPNLKKVTTSHRISKFVWNCPVEDEFSTNITYLDSKPRM